MKYVEPHELYDAYDAQRNAEYQLNIQCKTCLECGNCARPHTKKHQDIGYCTYYGEFVTADDEPEQLECEKFI